jgi:magnesium transporter
MKSIYKYKSATWVDLVEPTQEEIDEVVEEYGIDPYVAHELTSPSLKHRVESNGVHVFFILYFPAFKQTKEDKESQEIDFIVGKDFVITVRYDEIEAVDRFAKKVEVESILHKATHLKPRDLVFFGLLKELAKGVYDQLSYIDHWVNEIEGRIFSGREQEMVASISEVSRRLISFKKIFLPYAESMKSLEHSGQKLFGDEFAMYARGLAHEFSKYENLVRSYMEVLTEMRETNNSLVSTKQNETMKILTIMAFVTFPLSLVAAVFGMNTANIPLVGNQYDFWIVIGIMVTMTLCFFTYFKYKKWF